MSNLIEVTMSKSQIDLMFAALKHAESKLTELGLFDACVKVGRLHSALWAQMNTYESTCECCDGPHVWSENE